MDPALAEMKEAVSQTLESKGVLQKIRVLYLHTMNKTHRNLGSSKGERFHCIRRTTKRRWSLFGELFEF
jgi:hypothetical protein